jgi:hypothetical protein
MANDFCPKPLGIILREADLVTPAQIEVALQDQQYYQLRLGEILALHGWVHQETADFFAEQWPKLITEPTAIYLLGEYFQLASLLNEQQIQTILQEQKKLGLRFGAIAVLQGWLKQTTVNYFLENLVTQTKSSSDFQTQFAKNLLVSTTPARQTSSAKQTASLFISESSITYSESSITYPSSLEPKGIRKKTKKESDLSEALNIQIAWPEYPSDQDRNDDEKYDLSEALNLQIAWPEYS